MINQSWISLSGGIVYLSSSFIFLHCCLWNIQNNCIEKEYFWFLPVPSWDLSYTSLVTEITQSVKLFRASHTSSAVANSKDPFHFIHKHNITNLNFICQKYFYACTKKFYQTCRLRSSVGRLWLSCDLAYSSLFPSSCRKKKKSVFFTLLSQFSPHSWPVGNIKHFLSWDARMCLYFIDKMAGKNRVGLLQRGNWKRWWHLKCK